MPPLPADAGAAEAAGPEAVIAFTLAAADAGTVPADDGVARLFTSALAALIRSALDPLDGDPTFQAQVLAAGDARVAEYLHLAAQATGDARTVRAAVNAWAHPGKLQGQPPGARPDALAPLHRLAASGAWTTLQQALDDLLAEGWLEDGPLRDALSALRDSPALARLAQAEALLALDGVQRYRALCERAGPSAGSAAAAQQGRASARLGAAAERSTVQALLAMAELIHRAAPALPRLHVAQGLLTPRGFPGVNGRAKDEWDVALLREVGPDGARDVMLLLEVKAAPAAAASDYPRLLRGLQRLALAQTQERYAFACVGGETLLRGASLRELAPQGDALPPQVLYACTAPAEPRTPLLNPVARAMLLAEPACIAFAAKLARGAAPQPAELAALWEELPREPRLRPVLRQYDTARRAREAMLHPDELLAAAAVALLPQARQPEPLP